MGNEERRDTSGEDRREFASIGREAREEQSPAVGEAGTEEDRRRWEKTRDLHEEAKQVTDKADQSHLREGDHDHPEG